MRGKIQLNQVDTKQKQNRIKKPLVNNSKNRGYKR